MGQLLERVREIATASLRRWGQQQVSILRRAFDAGGHSFHGGAQWRPRKDPEGPFLGGSAGRIALGTFVDFAGTRLRLGNSSDLAAVHHYGTREIPARPLVVITAADLERLKDTMRMLARSM